MDNSPITGGWLMRFTTTLALLMMMSIQLVLAQTGTIRGIVRDAEDEFPLAGANVTIVELNAGTISDEDGLFVLPAVPPGKYTLRVTFLGYVEVEEPIEVSEGGQTDVSIFLKPTILRGKEVIVIATRAVEGETPAAFATLKKEDVQIRYFAQDIPALLSELPSTKFYSESGNAIGYNYLSIRGFGQRRVSVLINGIPQNDPEDHNVYWVDFPDFLDNVEDIQVQRGAGSAFYGPAAIGGSINIITTRFSSQPYINAYSGYGTYNTQKYSLALNSGLIKDRFIIFGRASQIKTDGYRERSWVDFKSFFLGAAMFGEKSTLKLHFYGGPIEDHLAYYGISKEKAQQRETRRENPIQRPDELENFNQPHLELIHQYQFNNHITLNNTLFGIRGYGFFDYDGSWAPMSYYRLTPEFGFDVQGNPEDLYVDDLLIRAYVDNKQAGWLPQLTLNYDRYHLVLGGEFRVHRSLHWGRIQKGSPELPKALTGEWSGLNYIGKRRYYEYKGAKDILSPYLQGTYRINSQTNLFLAMQLAYKRYRLYEEKFLGNDFTLRYTFFNPRVGINYKLTPESHVYVSYSRTTREPRLKNFYDAAEASTPESWGPVVPQFELNPDGSFNFDKPLVKPETLNDFEAGIGLRNKKFSGEVNLYYMDFENEIVKKGQLDRFGQPITGNAERTLHMGVELSAAVEVLPGFTFSGNATFSKNELKKYTDFSSGSPVKLDGNPIAGFPDFLANARLTYHKGPYLATLSMQHVGKQYTDNYKNELNTVDPYTVFHGSLGYSLRNLIRGVKINLQLHVQNIFDSLYITHGEGDEFFPAAERQIFLGMRVEM
ncbi:MAG: TonB-dependent receptor [Calditrichaeota bacterium]|nr:MAG: TonB-dependent receptor [Calditrichota bacterium]